MIWLNLLLALAWVVTNGAYGPANWAVGLILGFVALRLSWRAFSAEPFSLRAYVAGGGSNPLVQAWRWMNFILFGLVEIVKSNIAVTMAVLSPRLPIDPGIVAIPLDLQSEAGITTLANLITLTPGTVSLDVSSDRKTLYIHAFDVGDPDQLRHEIKTRYERRVKELLP